MKVAPKIFLYFLLSALAVVGLGQLCPFSSSAVTLVYLEKDSPAVGEASAAIVPAGFYALADLEGSSSGQVSIWIHTGFETKEGFALVENSAVWKNQKALAWVFPSLPYTEEDLDQALELPVKSLRPQGQAASNLFPSFYFYKVEYPAPIRQQATILLGDHPLVIGVSLARAEAARKVALKNQTSNREFLSLLQNPLPLGLPMEQVLVALGEPNRKIILPDKQLWLYWEKQITFQKGKVSHIGPRFPEP